MENHDQLQSRFHYLDVASGRSLKFRGAAVLERDTGLWAGFRLERWLSGAGFLGETVLPETALVLSLGSPSTGCRWSPGERREWARIRPGTACILPAGIPYSAESKDPVDNLILSIAPAMLSRLAYGEHGECVLRPCFVDDAPLINHAMHALRQDAVTGHAWGPMYGETICAAIAAELGRQYSSIRPRAKGKIGADDLNLLKDHIRNNLDRNLPLSELAAFVGMNAFTFAKAFKAATGVPPHRYVLQARLDAAKRLLRSSAGTNVLDVAVACGFTSQSYFSGVFMAHMGVTPTAYRKLA